MTSGPDKSIMEEKIFFDSRDGVELCGKFREVKDSDVCVIMAHGANTGKDEWNDFYVEVADRLEENGFSSFRFDFRGHGESGGQQEDMTIIGEILDIKAAAGQAIERGHDRFIVVGSSFGALASIYYAWQKPGNVESLILLWPLLDLQNNYVESGFLDSNSEEVRQKGFIERDDGFRMGAQLAEELRLLKPYEKLQELDVPVLTIQGVEDELVSYQVAKRYGSPNSDSKFVEFENAGHGLVDKRGETDEEVGPRTKRNWKEMMRQIVDWCKSH